MTNREKILNMTVADFISKFNYSIKEGIDKLICRGIACTKCPSDDKYNCLNGLSIWLNKSYNANDISDEAKNLSYNKVLKCYYFCQCAIGCGNCELFELEDPKDLCCDNIFDYHFSKPDCPYDPRK